MARYSLNPCEIPALVDECLGIKNLVEVSHSDAVNLEIQQAYEPVDKACFNSASASFYKIGPCFDFPATTPTPPLLPPPIVELCKYYPSTKSKTLVEDFTGLVPWRESRQIILRYWHKPDKDYCNWVKKLEKRLAQKWRDLRIYETIILSIRSISFDDPLMTALFCFWERSCNAFLLPEGPIGITMEDVVAITSCSPVGVELSTLGTSPPGAEDSYRWTSNVRSYSKFLKQAKILKDPDQEEMAFYLYWVGKFLLCNQSGSILTGHKCLAETIFHAKGPIALAPFLLGASYNCLGSIVGQKFKEYVSGPLWLVLLWSQAYFEPIAARNVVPGNSILRQQSFKSICSYGDQIIFSQVQCERTFDECFNYLIDLGRKRQEENWNPFLKREYGADWFRNFTLHQEHIGDANDAWKAILIARDLPAYFNTASIFLEPYSPNQFARQFGHIQSVPVPFYQTINQPWYSRKNMTLADLKHAEQNFLTRKSVISQVHRFLWSASSESAFDSWWACYWDTAVLNLSNARDYFVSIFEHGPGMSILKRPSVRSHWQRGPPLKRRRRRCCDSLGESTSSSAEESEQEGGGEPEEEDPEEEEEDPEEEEEEEEEHEEEQAKLAVVEEDRETTVILTQEEAQKCIVYEDGIQERGTTRLVPMNEESSLKNAAYQGEYDDQEVEQCKMMLKRYLGMPIESILNEDELGNLVKVVDVLYHVYRFAEHPETHVLGVLRKQLTGLHDKIHSLSCSIDSANAEIDTLHGKHPDLSAKLNHEKQALEAEESKLSQLASKDLSLEKQIEELIAEQRSVQTQRNSTAKNINNIKQKMEKLKNTDDKIRRAVSTCFELDVELCQVNACTNATFMNAKKVLFK